MFQISVLLQDESNINLRSHTLSSVLEFAMFSLWNSSINILSVPFLITHKTHTQAYRCYEVYSRVNWTDNSTNTPPFQAGPNLVQSVLNQDYIDVQGGLPIFHFTSCTRTYICNTDNYPTYPRYILNETTNMPMDFTTVISTISEHYEITSQHKSKFCSRVNTQLMSFKHNNRHNTKSKIFKQHEHK